MGLASYTFLDQKTAVAEIAAGPGFTNGLTGAYNVKLGDRTKGVVQPMVGSGRSGPPSGR